MNKEKEKECEHDWKIIRSWTRSTFGYPCHEDVFEEKCTKCGREKESTCSYMYDNK